jgi:hypothetical protein
MGPAGPADAGSVASSRGSAQRSSRKRTRLASACALDTVPGILGTAVGFAACQGSGP